MLSPNSISTWNSSQYKCIESIYERKKNVFITGHEGSGKSEVIKNLTNFLKKNDQKFALTSTTDFGALKIGGVNVRSYFHLKKKKEDVLKDVQSYNKWLQKFKTLNLLIIDQVENLDVQEFEDIDYILRNVKQDPNLFANVQIVLSGNFYKSLRQKFLFESSIFWKLIDEVHFLNETFIQNDTFVFSMLKNIRRNCFNDYEKLNDRTNAKQGIIIPTKILNQEKSNEEEVEKLPGKEYFFETFFFSSRPNGKVSHVSMEKIKKLLNPVTKLKVGAQVMLNQNINVEKGLIKGSRGVIVDFTTPKQKQTNFHLLKCQWVLPEDIALPIVQFKDHTIKIPYFVDCIDNCYFWSLGISLAWYIHIEHAEGYTFDCASLNLNDFENKYYALSKIKSLDSLFLEEKVKDNFKINQKIIDFYEYPFYLQRNLSGDDIEFASEKEIIDFFTK